MTAPRPRPHNPALPVRAAVWWPAASCRGADIETFFPPPGDLATVQRALMTCDQCPVRIPCRRYALDHRERHGIWGGLTEETRETLLRMGPPTARARSHEPTELELRTDAI
ncbi:WhiB family transcriptional regulator [Streptomyces sp. NPDC006332]|uniref:WhiB family transcriptional regulator n=1 Tax=Streptomyces sp. NPDC006332 TaxID=3155456 RepID=UPI0033B285DE